MTSIEQSYPAARVRPAVLGRLWVLAAAMFAVGTNAFVIAGILPDLARDFGTSTAHVSTAITWYAAIVAIASPLVATFLTRVPRRTLLTAGMGLAAIGIAITAIAGSAEIFIVGRIVAAFGGAALVPPAIAAAPALVEPAHRGRAIAIVTFGFSGAVAFGSPLGTALAASVGWSATLGIIAGLAVVLTAVIGVTMTDLPSAAAADLRTRLAVLVDRRILFVLLAMVSFTMSFNVLYVFSAEVLASAVHSAPTLLALVLLAFGLATLIGTWIGGRAVDRIGGARVTVISLLATAVVYAAIDVSTDFLVGAIVLYALLGIVAMPTQVAIQDLLIVANPPAAGVTLSWYSTAMYVGIALAPLVGGAALGVGPMVIPLAATAAALLALALVLGGGRPVKQPTTIQPASNA